MAASTDATCSYEPSTGTLPTWARAGFRPPYSGWKFVTSKSGHIVNVPTAGCWRFTLHWIGGTDSVDIVYGST